MTIMCLDDQIISEYIDGELQEPWKTQLEEHLDWCPSCKKRFEDISSLKTRMNESVLEEDIIQERQDRVLKYITANVLHKKSKFKLFKEKIESFIKVPLKRVLIPAAAACLTFCFCLIFFNGNSASDGTSFIEIPNTISVENITPVRLSDNYTTNETLERYSLDDILKYLDEKGYDVSIKVKSIKPLDEGEVIKDEGVISYNFILPNISAFTFNPNVKFSLGK